MFDKVLNYWLTRQAQMTMELNWSHLVRFIAEEDGQIHLGQVDASMYKDVGLSIFEGETVRVREITGDIFSGHVSTRALTIERVSCVQLILCLHWHIG